MTQLLIVDYSKKNILDETSFGGLPVKGIDKTLEWPTCQTCKAEMQYLGKVKTDIGFELIFMCNNDPGMCDNWDAEGGGNKVVVVDEKDLEFCKPIDAEASIRETDYGVTILETKEDDYENARESWKGGSRREVLGQVYGEPSWLQGDETPECDCCNKPMRFVAQLEEGPDHRTAMNFGGGGVAYLFDCTDGKTAKFLWQS